MPNSSEPKNESSVETTFLMPCLDEALTIVACVDEAFLWLDKIYNGDRSKFEVLVSDNGSKDNSVALAESRGARVVSIKEKGYGSAIRGGIDAALGRYIIMSDSDLSYDFEPTGAIIKKLAEGNDLVMGNRFSGKIDPGAMPFLHKYLGNPVLSLIGRLFFRIPVRDFHCGIRGFRKDTIDKVGLNTPGMELASEMVVKCALSGYKLAEVPAHLRKDGRDRPPHLKTWRDGWRHLRFLLAFCPRALYTLPGLLLFVVGMVSSGVCFYSNSDVADANTVLSIVGFPFLAIAGFQLAAMGIVLEESLRSSDILPPRKSFHKKYLVVTELSVALGLLMTFSGLLSMVFFFTVSPSPIAPENITQSLRILSASLLSLVLGVQVGLSAFVPRIIAIFKEEKRLASSRKS